MFGGRKGEERSGGQRRRFRDRSDGRTGERLRRVLFSPKRRRTRARGSRRVAEDDDGRRTFHASSHSEFGLFSSGAAVVAPVCSGRVARARASADRGPVGGAGAWRSPSRIASIARVVVLSSSSSSSSSARSSDATAASVRLRRGGGGGDAGRDSKPSTRGDERVPLRSKVANDLVVARVRLACSRIESILQGYAPCPRAHTRRRARATPRASTEFTRCSAHSATARARRRRRCSAR